jgi:hypothetical protein
VTVNRVHPGVVRSTALGRGERFPLPIRVAWPLLRPFMKSPEQGANTSVYAATSPDLEGVSGRFLRTAAKHAPARRPTTARWPSTCGRSAPTWSAMPDRLLG